MKPLSTVNHLSALLGTNARFGQRPHCIEGAIYWRLSGILRADAVQPTTMCIFNLGVYALKFALMSSLRWVFRSGLSFLIP